MPVPGMKIQASLSKSSMQFIGHRLINYLGTEILVLRNKGNIF